MHSKNSRNYKKPGQEEMYSTVNMLHQSNNTQSPILKQDRYITSLCTLLLESGRHVLIWNAHKHTHTHRGRFLQYLHINVQTVYTQALSINTLHMWSITRPQVCVRPIWQAGNSSLDKRFVNHRWDRNNGKLLSKQPPDTIEGNIKSLCVFIRYVWYFVENIEIEWEYLRLIGD